MKDAFRKWLEAQSYTAATCNNQMAQAHRVEAHYGDLDAAYDADRFAAIRSELAYSREDARQSRPNPSRFDIDGDVYSNLATYRATLNYYTRFRESEAAGGDAALAGLRRNELEALKARFLSFFSGFEQLGFQASQGGYWDEERAYKEAVLAKAREILDEAALSDEELGRRMLDVVRQPPANFVSYWTFMQLAKAGREGEAAVSSAIGEMLRSPADAPAAAAEAAAKIHAASPGGNAANRDFGLVRTLVTTILALARPHDAIAVKTQYMQRLAKQLTGKALFRTEAMSEAEYRSVITLAEAIFEVMQEAWGWRPRDLWDVQGFLWVVAEFKDDDQAEEPSAASPNPEERSTAVAPTNLILYGPPGTGKTYATAERAVRLCDGRLPDGGRAEVMRRYRELVERRRIAFVTFHQSYAYEDFVEGLRPETAAETSDGRAAAGFSLVPQPGVFRMIAESARANRGPSPIRAALKRDRQVFKMSLGRSSLEEGARLFQEALRGGYVVLGWGGEVDWSAPEYEDFQAIKARWREVDETADGNDANVKQLYALRAGMKDGDLVVVSDGNKRFRAIGEVTGPYEFVPGYLREYNHRRPVRWLWSSPEGLPRELIYARQFVQPSCYQLDPDAIDWDALEQIITGAGAAGGAGAPEPYVLIIDEINRANVSKVFGELITLIEPDKRQGADNALTVTLPYSKTEFGVPANLHIIGTMNTADRSIALLDTALRRRFDFEELKPEPALLREVGERTAIDLEAALSGLNARIEYLFDREHQIGHAFFMGCRTPEDVHQIMRRKVIPLLAEYFYEDWEKVRQALGETTDEGAFVGRRPLNAPANGDQGAGDTRWRYFVRQDFAAEAYRQLSA